MKVEEVMTKTTEPELQQTRKVKRVDETFVGGKLKNMHRDRRERFASERGHTGGATGKAIVQGMLDHASFLREKHLNNVFDDAANDFNEVLERWKNRLTRQGQSTVEQYKDGRISVICDLAITPSHFVSSDPSSADNPWLNHILMASVVFHADAVNNVHVHHWEQEPVLIEDIQIVQGPKGVIPSLVWLYDIHNEVTDCLRGLMYQSAINGRYKFIPRLAERESGVVVVSMKSPKDDFIDQNIQSSFQIVQRIAKDEGQVSSVWDYARHLNFKHIVSSLKIVLDRKRVNCTVNQQIAAGVKIHDVLIGPLDL